MRYIATVYFDGGEIQQLEVEHPDKIEITCLEQAEGIVENARFLRKHSNMRYNMYWMRSFTVTEVGE